MWTSDNKLHYLTVWTYYKVFPYNPFQIHTILQTKRVILYLIKNKLNKYLYTCGLALKKYN